MLKNSGTSPYVHRAIGIRNSLLHNNLDELDVTKNVLGLLGLSVLIEMISSHSLLRFDYGRLSLLPRHYTKRLRPTLRCAEAFLNGRKESDNEDIIMTSKIR